jgi:hypothetical protein
MKPVISAAVAAVVLTWLTGLAEAENKDCTEINKACWMSLPWGPGSSIVWERDPLGRYAKVSQCIRARGCVPLSETELNKFRYNH